MCMIYAINPLFYCKILGLCKKRKYPPVLYPHYHTCTENISFFYTWIHRKYKQKRILFVLRVNMVLCCSDISLVVHSCALSPSHKNLILKILRWYVVHDIFHTWMNPNIILSFTCYQEYGTFLFNIHNTSFC